MLTKMTKVETFKNPTKDGDNEDYVPIYLVLKPLLLSMKLQGIFYQTDDGNSKSTIIRRIISMKTFCVLNLIISTLNIIRYIPAFWIGVDYVADILALRVIAFTWFLQCFCNRCILLRACWKDEHLPAFFRIFNQIMTDEIACCLQMNAKCKCSRRFAYMSVCIGWAITVFNVACLYYITLSHIQEDFDVVITNPFSRHSLFVKVSFMLIFAFESTAWIFPVIFQLLIFRLLSLHLNVFKRKLTQSIKDEGNHILWTLRKLRLRHLRLCKLVEIFEQDANLFLAFSYITNLFIVCFTMYQMVNSKDVPWVVFSAYASWCIWCVGIVLVLSIGCACVNEEAHSPLAELFDMDTTGATQEQLAELTLFLSKLNGPPIGFSVLGMCTVTKELILTMFGLFVTYFFLLIQFNI